VVRQGAPSSAPLFLPVEVAGCSSGVWRPPHYFSVVVLLCWRQVAKDVAIGSFCLLDFFVVDLVLSSFGVGGYCVGSRSFGGFKVVGGAFSRGSSGVVVASFPQSFVLFFLSFPRFRRSTTVFSGPPCSDLVALRHLSTVSSIVACWVVVNELRCPFFLLSFVGSSVRRSLGVCFLVRATPILVVELLSFCFFFVFMVVVVVVFPVVVVVSWVSVWCCSCYVVRVVGVVCVVVLFVLMARRIWKALWH